MATGAPDWWIQGIIPLRYLNLSDTPGDYIGRAGLVPEVNAGESALEWSDTQIDNHKARHKSGGADEIDITGLTPKLHEETHKSGGTDEIDITGLTPKLHEATHRDGGTDVLLHNNMARGAADHHAVYLDANARAAINNIFGADGKADADIDLDGHLLESGGALFGPVDAVTINCFVQNAYYDAPNWKYVGVGFAVLIQLNSGNGNIYMYTAPSGLLGGVIAWTMRFHLDVSGNLTGVATYDGLALRGPIGIPAHAFVPALDSYDYVRDTISLKNRTVLLPQVFIAPCFFPEGIIVNNVTLYGYRVDALCSLVVNLYRMDRVGGTVTMATCTANWTSGWSYIADSTITSPTIDNTTYDYCLSCTIDPTASVEDVRLGSVRVSFT